jgi:amino acid transporter
VAALISVLVVVAANLGLAVVLIVAGVLVLRATAVRPRGRRPHTVWAVIKIPLALAASACLYWMLNSFLRTSATLPPGLVFGNPAVARATRWAHAAYWPTVLAPALGCVYAIVVLVAFRTPAIRDFYRRSD